MIAKKTSNILIFLLLILISLGAYTRLKDAGLGCPDWPGCYGAYIVPEKNEISNEIYDLTFFDQSRAWIEMVHRYLAGFLGILIIYYSYKAVKNRHSYIWPFIIITSLFFQGYLGMLTVTKKLQPIIVTAHLVTGISLLLLIFNLKNKIENKKTRPFVISELLLFSLYFLQLFLGAWVSTNYAGLSCQGFFTCNLDMPINLPEYDEIFNFQKLWLSEDPLSYYSNNQKSFIQIIHRINAIFLGISIFYQFKKWSIFSNQKRNHLIGLVIIFLIQVFVGFLIAVLKLPISLAVTHNFLAAFLGLGIVSFINKTNTKEKEFFLYVYK